MSPFILIPSYSDVIARLVLPETSTYIADFLALIPFVTLIPALFDDEILPSM